MAESEGTSEGTIIPQTVSEKFRPGKIDIDSIRSENVATYGEYLRIITKLSSVTEDQIKGNDDSLSILGIHTFEGLVKRASSFQLALKVLADSCVKLGVAEDIKDSSDTVLGIQNKIELVDNKKGSRKIVIAKHENYIHVRITDATRPISVDDTELDRPLYSLTIPSHMNIPVQEVPGKPDSSNFHATRYNEQTEKWDTIDPGIQTDESTLQTFASVISDIAGNISSVLPEEKEMRVFLENIGWDGGSTDFPNEGGGGPWNPPDSGGSPSGDAINPEEAEKKVLVPFPVRRIQEYIKKDSE
jgi:hypothetical protein